MKYLTIALAIVALVFAILYFTKPEPTVGDIYEGITADVKDCNDRIASWKVTYDSQPASAKKQGALDDILQECKEDLSASDDKLEQ